MAKNNNLTDFLTGVAGAIRAKKGTTNLINPQDFESEIASISTEKPEQEKSITVTENKTTEVMPDSGKVLSKVTITTNVPSEKPTLNAVAISLDGSIITITPTVRNGSFVTGYKVYANMELLDEITTVNYDLSQHITAAGTYVVAVKAVGTNFNDSAASNAVSYTCAPKALTTPVISLALGTTIQIDTIDENAQTIEVYAGSTKIGEVSKQ